MGFIFTFLILQDHLTRPGPDLASVATQTNDHQAESEGHLLHKAVQTDRDPVFFPKAEQEVRPVQVNVSPGISYRSHSFSFSASRDLVQCGPRCSSLKTLSTQDAFRPPSKTSLLQGTSVIASVLSRLDQPSNSGTLVSKMSDLVPWEESRCTIELGRGATGSVYLFRHAVSNIPVAAKVVEYAGECFRNEVRIHQAISGLPWFPRFYGSFDIDDDQAVLAMEFIGDDSEDRSYSLTDCLDRSMLKSGPDLTRDEWFDVLNNVAKGLKALHSKGFLSNDIKEDNVLVVEESGVWQAKIIDLGWASEISTPFVMDLDEDQIDFYQSGRGCGHIAPECVLDNRPCSTSSDVYSLGKLISSIGRKMRYDDFECIGNQICMADEEHRPTVQEIIDQFYAMQMMEGGEDDLGSSSC
nr:uncharacterized protein LOC129268668 [Lytechinus pictus]